MDGGPDFALIGAPTVAFRLMNVTVRAAGVGDERTLAELNALVQDLHVTNRPAYFKAAAPDEVAAWFRDLLAKAAGWIWIAERDGNAVGYVLALAQERPENPFCHARRWVEIDQLAVRPGHRRAGVARALVEAVRRAAEASEITEVELTCWDFNGSAREVFRKLGFTPRVSRLGSRSSGS